MRIGRPPAKLVAGVWLTVATAASIVMRLGSPAWLIADSPHDDGLFAKLAGNLVDGHWLGVYDKLTLAKGPAYPLFMAVVYELHLPLKLSEHVVHLVAGAVMGLAVWRVSGSRLLGVATYTVIAIDPAYLGATAAKVFRDGLYASLSLLLVGGSLLMLTLVPALAARGPRWSVPSVLAAGPLLGLVAAGYYLCREERSWLAPALVVAGLAGIAHWRRQGRIGVGHGLVVLGTVALAATSFLGSLHWTASRNHHFYGTTVFGDLADGEIARAYSEWQRVEAGPARRYVPVSSQQRQAVYAISPAAAELEEALEGATTGWIEYGCDLTQVCGDYIGAFFVWALRDAAAVIGYEVSGAEAQRFFGEIADDIAEACGDELRCIDRGIGPMPPLSRLDAGDLVTSYRVVAESMLSYDVGEPERPWPSGGAPESWETMTRPIRGAGSQADHVADEARAMRRQEAVSALTDLYRWGARVGAVVALVGLALGVATRAGRRHPAALLVCGAMLTAVLSRVGLVALVDATSWPVDNATVYLLPGVDFLLVFVILGCWIGATAADRSPQQPPPSPSPAGSVDADTEVPPDHRVLQPAGYAEGWPSPVPVRARGGR
jgi:hypothetical protein